VLLHVIEPAYPYPVDGLIHVVRHAPCPVLVVREHEHEFI